MNERFAPSAIWLGLVGGIIMAATADAQYRWLTGEPQSWVLALMTVIAGIMAGVSIGALRRQARNERLGMQGEVAVAETLQQLVPHGYRILHDVQPHSSSTNGASSEGGGPNIDHVVVGPAGVFVIETKTRSKPASGGAQAVVSFNGSRVLVDGHAPDRDPLVQVLATAADVARYLHQTLRAEIRPRPVVLYPGWFVKTEQAARGSDVWVLNDPSFVKWVLNEEDRVTPLSESVIADIERALVARCR